MPEIKDVSVQTERKERVQQQQAVQQPVQPEEEEEEEEEVTQVNTKYLDCSSTITIRYFLASLLCICD